MIEITNGNPTPDEIAALVAALVLVAGTAQPSPTGAAAARWRRSKPIAEVDRGAPIRRPRRCGGSCTGWTRVVPAVFRSRSPER
jgi:hypothetical protein